MWIGADFRRAKPAATAIILHFASTDASKWRICDDLDAWKHRLGRSPTSCWALVQPGDVNLHFNDDRGARYLFDAAAFLRRVCSLDVGQSRLPAGPTALIGTS